MHPISGAARRVHAWEERRVWLVRTLDWPFTGLGRYVAVARMQGECGDFLSVTWPGYVGALTAMAAAPLRGLRQSGADARLHGASVATPQSILRSTPGRPGAPIISCRRINCCAERLKFAGILQPHAGAMLEDDPGGPIRDFPLAGCAPNEALPIIERTETGFTEAAKTKPAPPTIGCRGRPGWEGRIGTRRF